MVDSASIRTLRRALSTLRGEVELASALGVRHEDLSLWLSGRGVPPLEAYLKALDIVAGGPLWEKGGAVHRERSRRPPEA